MEKNVQMSGFCLVPVRRLFRPSRSMHFGAVTLACVAGAKRGGRGGKGEKHERGERESLFPYPLPLSTPATQAR